MKLKLYNTLNRQVEEFQPIDKDQVLIYTCGPTVYNELHVGNWSAYIYWDVLIRVLRADDYTVKQIINITDVGHLTDDADEGEDKLEAGAKREGSTAWEVAKKYTENYLAGRKYLNLLPPHLHANATDYIDQQLELAQRLNEKGVLYQIDDGLYFDTSKFKGYQDFANLNLEAQQSSARISPNPKKRQASDFAVWKFSPVGETRSMEWDTPVEFIESGQAPVKGFPGWHLECSAIILSQLADTIDIHTGGIDHIPVHHTNEIAQSQTATGQQLANYWLHNNHMKSDGVKISKSLNNGYTIDDLKSRGFDADDFKMFVLQSHYQSETNFTFENLQAASNRLKKWKEYAVMRWQSYETLKTSDERLSFLPEPRLLLEILNENLNTPQALSFIDTVFNKVSQTKKQLDRDSFVVFLEAIDSLLGFNLIDSTPDVDDDIKRLVVERKNLRGQNDWKAADDIRQELLKRGVAINDTSQNSFWYYS